jgi:Domain of unknown function (DUF4159)
MNRLQTLVGILPCAMALVAVADPQYRTAREAEAADQATPNWTNPRGFKPDVFTFVRVKYHVDGKYGFGHTRPDERWMIDFPEADLNFSFRLQQLTALKVDPNTRTVELTEKELFDYPFIYIVEAGRLTFTDQEASILRKYLLNGGFLMVDDFWGEREWRNFQQELKLVFPDRDSEPLPPSHPIFHCVFDLNEKPQIPGEPHWSEFVASGGTKTWEREDAKQVDYRGIFDDKRRLMVLICHNTDLGDGWEREGYNEGYFHQFSEKSAYPLGINIIYYVMTH